MDKIVIEGGRPLEGIVKISGAKNAVLPVLAATLLTSGRNVISGIPKVRDVATMIQLLKALGVEVENNQKEKIILDTSCADNPEAPYDLVSTMRASCLVLGPLLAKLGRARVSLPGGCAIGERPIDLHIKGLEAMGAKVRLEQGYVHGAVDVLKGTQFYFDTVSVTGTANLMMAASLAEGETVLENAAKEPEVVFLADILNRAGAKITGQGTDMITIQGVSSLNPIECVKASSAMPSVSTWAATRCLPIRKPSSKPTAPTCKAAAASKPSSFRFYPRTLSVIVNRVRSSHEQPQRFSEAIPPRRRHHGVDEYASTSRRLR